MFKLYMQSFKIYKDSTKSCCPYLVGRPLILRQVDYLVMLCPELGPVGVTLVGLYPLASSWTTCLNACLQ